MRPWTHVITGLLAAAGVACAALEAQAAVTPAAMTPAATASQTPADTAAAPATGPMSEAIVQRPPLFGADDLLLFEMDVGGQPLTDAFGAYSSRAGVFLPLGALARLLDLAITVDAGRGRAEGWVAAEGRTFRLDLNAGRAAFDGRGVSLAAADAIAFDDDIYVRADVMQQILPIDFKVDARGLVIAVVPRETLPFQARLERERRSGQLQAGSAGQEAVLTVSDPYSLAAAPSFDLVLNAERGNHAPTAVYGYDLRAAGDLLYADAQFHAASDAHGRLDGLTLLFDRKDPDGRLLRPLGLSRLSFGDTYTPQLPLGARSTSGRGVFLTSAPLDQASVFNKIDIHGELPAGYQVELYLNEVLKASQLTPVGGRYDFPDVDLSFGLNVVRLVFYGPHGERREEVQRFNVDGGQLARGQTVFSLGAVQAGVPLLDVLRRPAVSGAPLPGDWRVTAQVAHGLTDKITVSAAFADYAPAPGERRALGVFGVTEAIAGYAAKLNLGVDDRGAGDLSLGLAGRPMGVSLVARHSEYWGGFVDELVSAAAAGGPALRRDSTLNLAYGARVAKLSFPLQFNLDRAGFAGGGAQWTASAQTSVPVGRYLLSSSLGYQAATGRGGGDSHSLTGGVDVSGLVGGGWQTRASLAYAVLPRLRVDGLSLTADRNLSDRLAVHFGVAQAFGAGRSTQFQMLDTLRFKAFDLSLTTSYATATRDARVGLQLSMGLGWDPLRRRYRPVAPGVSTGGGMAIEAFKDDNGDGLRQPGEAGEAGVKAAGGRGTMVSGPDGELLVTGLGDSTSARVRLDLDALGDPYLLSPPTTIAIVPRPGRIAAVPYPIGAAGEAELRVAFARPGEKPRPLAALGVQLADAKGTVVARGHTEFDGSWLVEGLRPGTYSLQLDPDQSRRLHMALAAPVKVVAPASGGYVGPIAAEVRLVAPGAPQEPATPPATVQPGSSRPRRRGGLRQAPPRSRRNRGRNRGQNRRKTCAAA